MNKIIVGVLGTGVIIGGIAFVTNQYQTLQANVTDVVTDEVTALETDLARINTELAAGRMSETEASIARATIQNRLQAINEAITQSSKKTLSDSERAIINEGLDRVKAALISYQSTLVELEATAKPRQSGGSRNRSIAEVSEDIVAQIEELVTEIDPEYVTDEIFDITPDDTGTTTDAIMTPEEVGSSDGTTATSTDSGTTTNGDEDNQAIDDNATGTDEFESPETVSEETVS